MAESDDVRDQSNGVFVELNGKRRHEDVVTLFGILRRVVAEIFFPDPENRYGSSPLVHRIKGSLSENVPFLCKASQNTGRDVLLWGRRGSPFRAALVVSITMKLSSAYCFFMGRAFIEYRAYLTIITAYMLGCPDQSGKMQELAPWFLLYVPVMVGTIALLTLTGLVVFMLFFLAATINAIVISLFMSLAAAGGILALFFACVTAIYIGALPVAVVVISTTTISVIIAVLIATGWIGFFLTVWLATKKSMGLAKHSLTMTG